MIGALRMADLLRVDGSRGVGLVSRANLSGRVRFGRPTCRARWACLARVRCPGRGSQVERRERPRWRPTRPTRRCPSSIRRRGSAAVAHPGLDVLREMARGGLAGLVVGLVVGGIGGRLLMRVAALLEPDAAGLRTENDNVIGAITFDGTLALLLFGGLLTGVIIGALWVVIRPWLPRRPIVRALVAIPICIAMGTTLLIQDTNPDFVILRRNLVVVAALVGLVALVGPSMVLAESVLDRLLPVVRRRGPALIAYMVIDALGALLVLALVVPLYLLSPLVVAGIAFVVAGIGSVIHWAGRVRGGPTRCGSHRSPEGRSPSAPSPVSWSYPRGPRRREPRLRGRRKRERLRCAAAAASRRAPCAQVAARGGGQKEATDVRDDGDAAHVQAGTEGLIRWAPSAVTPSPSPPPAGRSHARWHAARDAARDAIHPPRPTVRGAPPGPRARSIGPRPASPAPVTAPVPWGPPLQGTARRWDGLEGAHAHPGGVGSLQTARAVPALMGVGRKGKPGVTRGRKATGLGLRDRPPPESAGLPDWRLVWLRPARASTRSCASSPLRRSHSRASPRCAHLTDADRRVTDRRPVHWTGRLRVLALAPDGSHTLTGRALSERVGHARDPMRLAREVSCGPRPLGLRCSPGEH